MSYYKIWNLELGYTKSPSEYSFDGLYRPGEFLYSPHSMTLIQGEGHKILVDCGVDVSQPQKKAITETFHVQNYHHPVEVLESIGLSAADIDVIIPTHLHYDHAGAMECFPNATFYVQQKELDGWNSCLARKKFTNLPLPVHPQDFTVLEQIRKEGRLILLDGDREDIFPGIGVMGFELEHSFASQAVTVTTSSPESGQETRFILTGDIGRAPENFLGINGSDAYVFNFKFAIGAPYNLALAYDRIFEAAEGDVKRIIMTHDGTKKDRYPHYKTGLDLDVILCSE